MLKRLIIVVLAVVGVSIAQAKKPAPATAAAPHVNAARAMSYTREFVGIGARKLNTPGHKKAEDYLRQQLKKDSLEEDTFTADTPAGKLPGVNFIAKFPGTKPGIIVLGCHYETNYNLKNFVGANDGGSTTGLLLELANQLRGKKRQGYSVWLVFFDAEEAVREWSDADSLYGSRHLADKWRRDGTLTKIKAFMLLDMIGDKDLDIQRDQNSTSWLEDLVQQSAIKLGYGKYFFAQTTQVQDDHLPFTRLGVATADIIDLDYGPDNSYHHTSQDTLDKLSAHSLQVVGDTVLETINQLDQR